MRGLEDFRRALDEAMIPSAIHSDGLVVFPRERNAAVIRVEWSSAGFIVTHGDGKRYRLTLSEALSEVRRVFWT